MVTVYQFLPNLVYHKITLKHRSAKTRPENFYFWQYNGTGFSPPPPPKAWGSRQIAQVGPLPLDDPVVI